jgi:hypothetical protein
MKRRILSLDEKIFAGIADWLWSAAHGVAGLWAIGAACRPLQRTNGEGSTHLAQSGSGDDAIVADDFDDIAGS